MSSTLSLKRCDPAANGLRSYYQVYRALRAKLDNVGAQGQPQISFDHPCRFANKYRRLGLDFSHCSAMWSYSAFSEFRSRLMEEADYSWEDVLSRKGADPLHVLLNHSDCEGYIEVVDCTPLADRLDEVTASWWADDKDRYETVLLIQGLRAASARGEILKFL